MSATSFQALFIYIFCNVSIYIEWEVESNVELIEGTEWEV